jgi:hypothetical protein
MNDLFKWQVQYYVSVDWKRRSVHSKNHTKSDLLVYQCEIRISSKVQFSNFKKKNEF